MSTKPCKLTYVNTIYVYTELFSKNVKIKAFILELLESQAFITLKTLPSTDILQFFRSASSSLDHRTLPKFPADDILKCHICPL